MFLNSRPHATAHCACIVKTLVPTPLKILFCNLIFDEAERRGAGIHFHLETASYQVPAMFLPCGFLLKFSAKTTRKILQLVADLVNIGTVFIYSLIHNY
jgi:hypothetical protein